MDHAKSAHEQIQTVKSSFPPHTALLSMYVDRSQFRCFFIVTWLVMRCHVADVSFRCRRRFFGGDLPVSVC